MIRPLLFVLLLAFVCLDNASAYIEGSSVTDVSGQEILLSDFESESEVFQLEQIAEREHPQQWRRRRRRPYPRHPRFPRYPYPGPIFPPIFIPGPIFVRAYNRNFLPYCSYLHHDHIDLPRHLRSNLFTAICDGETEIAKNIILHGSASPHRCTSRYRCNFPHRGVSPRRPWMTGETPLMVAAQTGNEELVEILVEEFHVNWRARDKWGHTAADWAYEKGHDDLGNDLCDLYRGRFSSQRCRCEHPHH